MKHLLTLLILCLAWFQPQISEACSPFYEEPEVDRGFDAEKSPAPELLDIFVHTEESAGCVSNTCTGQETVEGEVMSDVPITHVAVVSRDSPSAPRFGSVSEVEEGVYSFSIIGDSAAGLRFYNAEGFHSSPRDVDVASSESGGCALTKSGATPLSLVLLTLLLVFGRRRESRQPTLG